MELKSLQMYLVVEPPTLTKTSIKIAVEIMFAILIPMTASFEFAVNIVPALFVACTAYLVKSCAIFLL